MNKTKRIIVSTMLLSATSVFASADVQNRCIVQFIDDVPSSKIEEIAKGLANKGNASISHTYKNSIKGMAINIPCFAAQAAFGRDKNIKSMQPDYIVSAIGKPNKNTTTPPVAQEVSWGTTTVGSFDASVTKPDGNKFTAWIIDSGIDLNHPDLNVLVDETNKIGFTTYGVRKKGQVIPYYDDNYGHGTHVAGIIGAKNNTEGTLGVAAGTTVVPVKVLDSTGNGYESDVIAGVEYVATKAKAGDCVNMSLGGEVPIDPNTQKYITTTLLETAIINAASNTGAYFVIAAGNGDSVGNPLDTAGYSPARINGTNIYTVASIDNLQDANGDYSLSSFSNYGKSVDFAAPGRDILSTYKGGGTTTMSGTSMATPHVCAALMSGMIIPASGSYRQNTDLNYPVIKIDSSIQ